MRERVGEAASVLAPLLCVTCGAFIVDETGYVRARVSRVWQSARLTLARRRCAAGNCHEDNF